MQAIILSSNTAIRAKVITIRTNARKIDGISKAILIEQLKEKLKSGKIVKFAYLKIMVRFVWRLVQLTPISLKTKFVVGGKVVKVMLLLHILIWKNAHGVPFDGKI